MRLLRSHVPRVERAPDGCEHRTICLVFGFDEPNLVPSAGLLPAAALPQRLGVEQLVDDRLTLAAHGHASGAKALTVLGRCWPAATRSGT